MCSQRSAIRRRMRERERPPTPKPPDAGIRQGARAPGLRQKVTCGNRASAGAIQFHRRRTHLAADRHEHHANPQDRQRNDEKQSLSHVEPPHLFANSS